MWAAERWLRARFGRARRLPAAPAPREMADAVARVTAGVAHDFNNLLQAQITGLEMIADMVRGQPEVAELADIALRTAHRGAMLTHHLLAYSGQQVLRPEAIDVTSFLFGLADTMPCVPGDGIEMQSAAGFGIPRLMADRCLLETALTNLVINARDAMPRGGRLRLEALAAGLPDAAAPEGLAEGSYAVFAVTDTGAGMEAGVLARACEPFFTTRRGKGAGLGLSMAQGFARQSGGALRLLSAPGHGTRAELWLPAAAGVPALEAETGRASGAGNQRRRLLLVDDASNVLAGLHAFLVQDGFEVVGALSGERAMVALGAGERFDMLVTDHGLPGLNGAELVRRALMMQPGLPALIITGVGREAEIETLPRQVQVLRKPFRRELLAERIRDAMAAV